VFWTNNPALGGQLCASHPTTKVFCFFNAWPKIGNDPQQSGDSTMSTFTGPANGRNNRERPSLESFLLLLVVAAIVSVCSVTVHTRDSLSYWAAGQQLIHHADPYSAAEVSKLEDGAGFRSQPGISLIMRNPPYALFLVLPLGLVGPALGGVLWSLLLLFSLVYSVRTIWTMHGKPKNHLHFIGYSFGPAVACLFAGQSAILVLLGLVLFLRLHTTHPFVAGSALWLCAIKPHLFLPFGTVLLVWIHVSKNYRVLWGAATAIGGSTAVTFLLDRSIWHQYIQMMRSSGIDREFIPCWSVALRLWTNPSAMWIQFALSVSGCVWAIRYFWTRRDDWDWVNHGSLLILVSVLVAPYAWFTDQAVLVSPLLNGAYRTTSRSKTVVLVLMSSFVVIQVLVGIPIHSALYLWTAPAWLAWYLWACRKKIAAIPEPAARPTLVS
jgi:hypothetical protein